MQSCIPTTLIARMRNVTPRAGSDCNPFLLCLRHPEEPCLPGCCSLSTLAQVIYHWMAAKGLAHFGQIPLAVLDGAEDLPEHILQEHLDTYFIAMDEPPFVGADRVLYFAVRATHHLGNPIDTAKE